MARVKKFKGLTEDQVTKLDIDEFIQLIPSGERRTLLRLRESKMSDYGSRQMKKFYARVRKFKSGDSKKNVKTHVREAVITPDMMGMTIGVHNGKTFVPVEVDIEKMGHRLGEYSHTTKRVTHSGAGVGATRGSKFVPLK